VTRLRSRDAVPSLLCSDVELREQVEAIRQARREADAVEQPALRSGFVAGVAVP